MNYIAGMCYSPKLNPIMYQKKIPTVEQIGGEKIIIIPIPLE